MNKKQLMAVWVMLVLLAAGASGCALVGAAVSAGIAYGISQASK